MAVTAAAEAMAAEAMAAVEATAEVEVMAAAMAIPMGALLSSGASFHGLMYTLSGSNGYSNGGGYGGGGDRMSNLGGDLQEQEWGKPESLATRQMHS